MVSMMTTIKACMCSMVNNVCVMIDIEPAFDRVNGIFI